MDGDLLLDTFKRRQNKEAAHARARDQSDCVCVRVNFVCTNLHLMELFITHNRKIVGGFYFPQLSVITRKI